MFGSGQLQAPFRQTELPGHCSLFVQATAPPQDLHKKQTLVRFGHQMKQLDGDFCRCFKSIKALSKALMDIL